MNPKNDSIKKESCPSEPRLNLLSKNADVSVG